MNQEQRKYLIEKIVETFKEQVEQVKDTLPEEPTMNNHLIGAFLDGSAKVLDAKKVKENITKFVKGLGGEPLVEEENDSYYNRRSSRIVKTGSTHTIKIDPSLIMEMPKSYLIAKKEYDDVKSGVDKKIKDLENQKDLLILKIQIGSNVILDKLITQVDSLGDLDLFSNRLTLIAEGIGETAEAGKKLIGNKKGKQDE